MCILAQSYMDSQGILILQSSMVWLWGFGNQWSMVEDLRLKVLSELLKASQASGTGFGSRV